MALQSQAFISYEKSSGEIEALNRTLSPHLNDLKQVAMIILCDDAEFLGAHINNFLWACFTRSNPSHDIYGIASFTRYKHWGCEGPLIIDARIKPHHAPVLVKDEKTEQGIERFFKPGGLLSEWA
jgi:4-hydroxy-3-polyprenylbenzoate decarboxylase